jgi:hypothetical protein
VDIDDVAAKIKSLRIMRGLDEGLKEKLTEIFQSVSVPRVVPAGGVFIHEREHVDNKGYILLQGAVLVRKDGFPDVTCKAPELIGEIMQFNPAGVRTATCAGAVESIVLRFMWDDFWTRAETALTPGEMDHVKETLETQAWEHFLR